MNSSFSQAVSLFGGELEDVLLRTGRSIGTIVPNVVIEEHHRDEVVISDHPIEQGPNGAKITDHAYSMPTEVTMRCGWSASAGGGIIAGLASIGQSPRDIYDQVLTLQTARQPIDVITGKRSYKNMLIKAVELTTNAATENCLILTITLRQVLIVSTQFTSLAAAGSHANPQNTVPAAVAGLKQSVSTTASQAAAAPSSALSSLFSGF